MKVGLAIGSNRVEVSFKPTFLDVGKEWQKVKIVQVKEGEPTTVHFDFGSDPPPLIFGENGAEMVPIPAGKNYQLATVMMLKHQRFIWIFMK